MEKECIFCKIIKGEIPSSKVYEDNEILAFNDINPAAPIHILVIPKKHISSLAEMQDGDEEIISKIYKVINEIAEKQGFKEKGYRVIVNCGKGFKEKGYRVIVNCGKDGGQEVGHLHFHLLAGKYLGEKIV